MKATNGLTLGNRIIELYNCRVGRNHRGHLVQLPAVHKSFCPVWGSNPLYWDLEAHALPVELRMFAACFKCMENCTSVLIQLNNWMSLVCMIHFWILSSNFGCCMLAKNAQRSIFVLLQSRRFMLLRAIVFFSSVSWYEPRSALMLVPKYAAVRLLHYSIVNWRKFSVVWCSNPWGGKSWLSEKFGQFW